MNINQAQNQPDSAQKQEFQGSSPYPSPPYGQPPALNQGAPGYQQPNQGYQQPNQGYQAAPTQQQQQQQPQQNAQFNPILQQHQLLIQSIMAQNNGQIPPQYAQLIEMTQMMIQAINQQPAPVQAQTQPPYQPAQSQSQYQSPYQQPQVQQQPIYQPPASAQVFNSQQPAPAQVQAQPPYQPAQSQSSLYQQSAPAQAPYQQATQAPYQQPVPQQPMYQQPAQAFNQQPLPQQPYQPVSPYQQQSPASMNLSRQGSQKSNAGPIQQSLYPSVPQLQSLPLSYYGQLSAHNSQILNDGMQITPSNDYNQNELNEHVKMWRNTILNENTTENNLVTLVVGKTPQQLNQINLAYKASFNKNLWSAFDNNLYSKNFSRIMVSVLRPHINFDVNEIHEALRSKSSDNYVAVIDILTGKTSNQIISLKNRYSAVFEKLLEYDVKEYIPGPVKNFILKLLTGNRSDRISGVESDVQMLFDAPKSLLESSDVIFTNFFATRPHQQIVQVADAFARRYGKSLESFVKNEAYGALEYALLSSLRFAFSPPEYAAEAIYRSVKGIGTDDAKLIRTLIRFFHHNSDLKFKALVSETYASKYGSGLIEAVRSDTSGPYQTLLLAILSS